MCIRQGGPRAFFDRRRHCLRRQHQCTQRRPLCGLGSAVFEPRCIGDCSASRPEILPRRAVWAGARGLSARTSRPLVCGPSASIWHLGAEPLERAMELARATLLGGCWKRPAASGWSATQCTGCKVRMERERCAARTASSQRHRLHDRVHGGVFAGSLARTCVRADKTEMSGQ